MQSSVILCVISICIIGYIETVFSENVSLSAPSSEQVTVTFLDGELKHFMELTGTSNWNDRVQGIPRFTITKPQFTFVRLIPGTTYILRYSAGNSNQWQEIEFTTKDDVPGDVKRIRAVQKSADTIELSWTRPSVTNGIIHKFWININIHFRGIHDNTLTNTKTFVYGTANEMLLQICPVSCRFEFSMWAENRHCNSSESENIYIDTEPKYKNDEHWEENQQMENPWCSKVLRKKTLYTPVNLTAFSIGIGTVDLEWTNYDLKLTDLGLFVLIKNLNSNISDKFHVYFDLGFATKMSMQLIGLEPDTSYDISIGYYKKKYIYYPMASITFNTTNVKKMTKNPEMRVNEREYPTLIDVDFEFPAKFYEDEDTEFFFTMTDQKTKQELSAIYTATNRSTRKEIGPMKPNRVYSLVSQILKNEHLHITILKYKSPEVFDKRIISISNFQAIEKSANENFYRVHWDSPKYTNLIIFYELIVAGMKTQLYSFTKKYVLKLYFYEQNTTYNVEIITLYMHKISTSTENINFTTLHVDTDFKGAPEMWVDEEWIENSYVTIHWDPQRYSIEDQKDVKWNLLSMDKYEHYNVVWRANVVIDVYQGIAQISKLEYSKKYAFFLVILDSKNNSTEINVFKFKSNPRP